MDKKSFIRGFGMGVLFTAIILGISCMIRTSDSAVVDRAKKLGMVYGTENNKGIDTKQSAEPAVTPSPAATEAVKQIPESQNTPAPTEKATKKPKATPKPTEKKAVSKNMDTDPETEFENEKKKAEDEAEAVKKEVTINAGEYSETVSKKLESIGVIDNAKEFDSYLNSHGYSDDIMAGNYNFSSDASFDEIAKEITKRK